jgi:phage terminase large subunit GpA-like protein
MAGPDPDDQAKSRAAKEEGFPEKGGRGEVTFHPASVAAFRADVEGALSSACVRFDKMPPLVWVEKVRRIPAKNGATRAFSFDYSPYCREMFEAFFDARNKEVIFQLFSRAGKSETVLNYLGYRIHQDPCAMVVGWPTNGQKKKWVKSDFHVSLIGATPALAELVPNDTGRRKSRNTLDQMLYPGGSLDVIAFTTTGDMRRTKGEVFVGDEIDAIKEHENDEGNPLESASVRASEFKSALEIYCSYPSVRGKSRIEAKLLRSDLRQWFVSCPICDREPFIMHRTGKGAFDDRFKRSRLLFDYDRPHEARIECPNCKAHLDDVQRVAMMRRGAWKATRQAVGLAGFHANAFLWPHPVDTVKYPGGYLQRIAERVIGAERGESPTRSMRVVVNTIDAETHHREFDIKPAYSPLYLRRESYDPEKMLPEGVLHILAFWDVQKNRVEGEVIGYGVNSQTWGLGYHVFKGSPLVPPNVGVWAEIDRVFRMTNFPSPHGPNMTISGGLVDAGNWKDHVYAFTRPRARLRIFPSRGSPSQKGIVGHRAVWDKNASPRTRYWSIGTNEVKEIIYDRLQLDNQAARGYMHYPDLPCYDEGYFKMLTAEDGEECIGTDGKPYTKFTLPDGMRNEALDVRGMSEAARSIFRLNMEKIAECMKSGTPKTPGAPGSNAQSPRSVPGQGIQRPGFAKGSGFVMRGVGRKWMNWK